MDLFPFSLFLLSFHLLVLGSDSVCQPISFPCGNFDLEFPLTNSTNPGCGLIVVDGCDSAGPITFSGPGYNYTILKNISSNKFLVQDPQLLDFVNNKLPCFPLRNLSTPLFHPLSFTYYPNITLFTCFNRTPDDQIQAHFTNYRRININPGTSRCPSDIATVYYSKGTAGDLPDMEESDIPSECSTIQLPLTPDGDSDDLFRWLAPNFTLEWSVPQGCVRSVSGNEYDCGDELFRDVLSAKFSLEGSVSEACNQCYHGGGQCLADRNNEFYCKQENNTTLKRILFIGGTTIAALTSALTILFVFIRRKRAKAKQEHEKDIKLFLKNNGNLVPMRYKYSSIKKMTKSFCENLGKGGYGSVYKGQFPDGHLVAVKILNESNGNGEEFMNEVASISRTSHINIVALLGFCFEGSKRALIYDFMPNGSLEKLIAGNTASSSAESGLGWNKLFEIALGIARGLEYLHHGCNTRILHLDIKPQNILLDRDLNPRISDFGLAKLCPNRSSIVSMLVARGTVGYIAPEVFSRNFGDVSYKSDVYSYGMLVLEMVGARKNIDPRDVDDTSEIYFPHYIYKQLEMDADRNCDLLGTMNEDESQATKRNLIIVGLWCIQTNPKDRPSMTKVVEMLEGKLGALEVPPKPYLYSPPRTAPSVSTSESL